MVIVGILTTGRDGTGRRSETSLKQIRCITGEHLPFSRLIGVIIL